MVECPKCWADSPQVWQAVDPRSYPVDDPRWICGDPFNDPQPIDQDEHLSIIYKCPVHGEFGFSDETRRPFFYDTELRVLIDKCSVRFEPPVRK